MKIVLSQAFYLPDVGKEEQPKRKNSLQEDLVIVATPHDVHPVAPQGAGGQRDC